MIRMTTIPSNKDIQKVPCIRIMREIIGIIGQVPTKNGFGSVDWIGGCQTERRIYAMQSNL